MDTSRPEYFLKILQKFPHRGTGTINEEKAAEVIAKEYKKMGLNPQVHSFKIVSNTWYPHLIGYLLLTVSTILLLLNYNFVALILILLGIVLLLRFPVDPKNLFKNIFPAFSQNVFVNILPQNSIYKKTVVIFAHIDTAKETFILPLMGKFFGKKTSLTVNTDKKLPPFLRSPFLITNISFILLLLSFFLAGGLFKEIILFYVLLTFIITFLVNLRIAFSPFVPGALDDGSGVAVVMSLARYFDKNKLKDTRIILLNNGSEESFTHGWEEFLREAEIDNDKTVFIDLEGVGEKKLRACYGESTDLGFSKYYDKDLFAIVKDTIKEEEFRFIKEFYLPVGSDCGELVGRGCRIMTILVSTNEDNYAANYHQMSDTIDNIDFETVDLCRQFVIRLVNKVDSGKEI